MKIRTDFVTNSSSSNFVTICMKNPKLTEIIRAARACKESDTDKVYHYNRLDINESEQSVKLNLEISDILDDFYYASEMNSNDFEDLEDFYALADSEDLKDFEDLEDFPDIAFPPEHLSDLPESLIQLLKRKNKYQSSNFDCAKLCSALEQNSEAIIAGMESADWIYDAEGYGEANIYTWFWALSKFVAKIGHLDYRPSSAGITCSFHYDRENGESFETEYSHWEPNQEDFTDEDDFTFEDEEDDSNATED